MGLSASLTAVDGLLIILAIATAALIMSRGWHRLEGSQPGATAISPPAALALIVLMLILEGAGALLARAAIGPETISRALDLPAIVILSLGAYGAQAIAIPIYRFMRGRGATAASHRSRRATLGLALAGLLLSYPLILAVTTLAGVAVTWITAQPPEPLAHATLQLIHDAPWDGWTLTMIGLVVLAAPALEEIMYRGLLQRALRSLGAGPWTAITLSSALFATMHLGAAPPHAVAGLLVFSLALGWAYERTGGLTAPILMHGLFNAANIAMALFGHER
jgi:membrane protease YdiL (CAAX protease family)